MRPSITGTATSPWARCAATAASVASASKRRCSTAVPPSSWPRARWPKPQEWNSGAAITLTSPDRIGSTDSSASPGAISARCLQANTPLGVPVVPEVRIIVRPGRSGRGGSPGSPELASSSSVGRSDGPSCPATNPTMSGSAPSRTVLELFVVHHGDHALGARVRRASLGSREPSVERDRIGTELGERRDRLDEAGVVPTQHAYLRPRRHPPCRMRRPARCCACAAPCRCNTPRSSNDRRAFRIPRGVGRVLTGKGRPVIPQRTAPSAHAGLVAGRPQEPRTA